ncbi:MAG: hypothetical protein LBL09_00700 [Oscillospiraceae bacterium]|nr:hypothetical protein [Oscillospiraceae bacterium]
MSDNVRKVLELVRDGTVSVDEGERLLYALDNSLEADGIYVEDIHTPWLDDGKLHVAAFVGKKLIKRQEIGRKGFILGDVFTLKLDGEAKEVDCWGHLECGDVKGNASSGLHMSVSGNVGGSVKCGTGITCGAIGGDAHAGTHIGCTGDILGSAKAGTGIKCNNVAGEAQDPRRGYQYHSKFNSRNLNDIGVAVENIISDVGKGISSVFNSGVKKYDPGIKMSFDWLPWDDDNSLRVAAFVGRRIVKQQDSGGQFTLHCEDEIQNVICYGDMNCQNIGGNVNVNGNLGCGDVEGSVMAAGGSMQCGDIGGDLDAAGSVKCGDVEGDLNAGGQVECNDVGGDVSSNGNITAGDVEGSCEAGGSITCQGIAGDATAKNGSINCTNIDGGKYI